MLISDYFFLIYFLPVFLLAYFLVSKHPLWSNLLLLAASLIYYASFKVSHLYILIVVLFIDYVIALLIDNTSNTKWRKIMLATAIVSNLSLLFYYKYFFWGITTVRLVLQKPFLFPNAHALIMPVGISFITFQRLSYIIDTFRRKIKPTANLIEYFVYAAFFPQLLAGPIVRFNQVKDQLAIRNINWSLIFSSLTYLSIGLACKILIADQLFLLEKRLTDQLPILSGPAAIILIIYFTFRIYFDFLGYSLMAIGLAKFVGFHFPDNFDSPYQAEGFRDFWRRWNITLSQWFQDYLYIPLGGSRKGTLRTHLNLMATMVLVGLWHGAGWSFLLWGTIHGGLLSLERLAGSFLSISLPSLVKKIMTFLIVAIAWVPFKFSDFAQLVSYSHSFARWNQIFSDKYVTNLFFVTLPALLMAMAWVLYVKEKNLVNVKPSLIKAVGLSLLFLFSLGYSLIRTQVPFIYFQF